MFVPLYLHWKLRGGEPTVTTPKLALPPTGATKFLGCLTKAGGNEVDTVKTALLLLRPGSGFALFVTTTEYDPESLSETFVIVRLGVPCSNVTMVTPCRCHLYPTGGAPETRAFNVTV